MENLRYIDLFAGMGGIRLGLEQSLKEHGIVGECVLTSEIKKSAIEVYSKNFKDLNIVGDISAVPSSKIPDFDMLLAGFPCQPFSVAGKQKGFEDTRGTLFFEIARILKDKSPNYFILENVDNLVTHSKGETFKVILSVLAELGYSVTWEILKSSDIGIPQTRKRLYIVGVKNSLGCKKIDISIKTPIPCKLSDILEVGRPCLDTEFTRKVLKYVKDAGYDLSYLNGRCIRDKRGSSYNIHSWRVGLRGEVPVEICDMLDEIVVCRRRNTLEKSMTGRQDGTGLSVVEIKEISKVENLEKELNTLVSQGYMKTYTLNGVEFYDIVGGRLSFELTKILNSETVNFTLVATEAGHTGVVDIGGIRRLTILEGLRLSGYPDDFWLDINYKKAMDLLGNTVTVPVVKHVCNKLLDTIVD